MSLRNRSYIVVCACLLIVSVLAGPVAARTFLPNQDASGNGFDLEVLGSPEPRSQDSFSKFGTGYDFDSAGGVVEVLCYTDDGLVFGGDASLAVAFSLDQFTTGDTAQVVEIDSGGFSVGVLDDGRVRLETVLSTGGRELVTDPVVSIGENISLWAKRDAGSLSTSLALSVWNETGQVVDVEESFTGSYRGEQGQPFGIGAVPNVDCTSGSRRMNGTVSEVRLWDSLLVDSTLDQVADPQAQQIEPLEAEGSERALWFLERFSEPGEVTAEIAASVYAPAEIEPGESFTIHARTENQTGHALEPSGTPFVLITRLAGAGGIDVVEHWNGSTWSTEVARFDMAPVSQNPNETLFHLDVPGISGFSQEDRIQARVWFGVGQTGSPESSNVTASTELQVVDVIEIAGMDASQLIELAIAGGIFVSGLWRRWILFAIPGLAMLPRPLLVDQSWYPLGFKAGILLAAIGLFIHYLIHNGWQGLIPWQMDNPEPGRPRGGA